jgi:hyperosmotically inducible protein
MKMRAMRNGMAWKAMMAASLAGGLMIAGCNSPHYPDAKAAVNTSLSQSNLGGISVSQDREKGVMTLTGTVQSQDQKMQAESIAKNTAPTYTIADEIGVVPPNDSGVKAANSDTDDAIEDNIKAEIKRHRNLDDQSISVKAKNGAVVLTGSVKTEAQKHEADQLAKKVPNVQQVVNELEVKPRKDSTSR